MNTIVIDQNDTSEVRITRKRSKVNERLALEDQMEMRHTSSESSSFKTRMDDRIREISLTSSDVTSYERIV